MNILKAIAYSSSVVIPAFIVILVLSGEINNSLVFVSIVFAYICGVLGVTLIGVPTHLVMMKLKIKSFIPYVSMGVAVPALLAWISSPFGADGFYWILWQGCLLGGIGGLCAYVFWRNAVVEEKTLQDQAPS